MPKTKVINVTPPLLGLLEGTAYSAFPEGGIVQGNNVRAYDAISGRARIGSRPGSTKFISEAINGTNSIQAMTKVVRAIGPTVTDGPGADETLNPTGGPGDDIGDGWFAVTNIAENTNAAIVVLDASTASLNASDQILYTHAGSINGETAGIASKYPTKNRATAVISALPQSSTSGFDDDLPNNGITRTGVYIRADKFHSEFIAAYLIHTTTGGATNFVTPVIVKFSSGLATNLWTGSEVELSGSGTPEDCTIRLEEPTTDSLELTISWPGAGPAAANIDISKTLTSAGGGGELNSPSNVHAGVGHFLGRIGRTRLFETLSVQRQTVQDSFTTIHQVDGSDTNPLPSPDRYYFPDGFTSVHYNVPTAPVLTVGPQDISSEPDGAYIDTSNNITSTRVLSAGNSYFIPTSQSGRPGLRVKIGDIAPNGQDRLGYFFRVSADRQSYILLDISVGRPSSTPGSRTGSISSFTLTKVIDGTPTTIANNTTLGWTNADWGLRTDDFVFVRETGSLTAPNIKVTVSGVTLIDYDIDPADILDTELLTSGVPNATVGFGGAGTNNQDVQQVQWVDAGLNTDGGEEADSASSVETSLIVVSGGTVKRIANGVITAPTGGSEVLSAQDNRVYLQPGFNRVFMADGDTLQDYDLSTNAVTTWAAATAAAPGARLLALYRGRLVLAGFVADAHNWVMSRGGDPDDFNESPATISSLDPVSGNNSVAGLVGDIITALIPISDDAMIFGGDSTIWQLTGDPAEGGAIDLVSDQTGIAFGRAWAKDPDNNVYFLGVDGIYMLQLGPNPQHVAHPTSLTRTRLDSRFKRVNLSENRVYLEWDFLRHGLMVQITNGDGVSNNEGFFWDKRTDSWWREVFPSSQGPASMYGFDGESEDDKEFLLGGRDSFIRKLDDSATTDDGDSFISSCRFPPMHVPGSQTDVILDEVIPVLGSSSSAVTLNVFTGRTPEEASTKAAPSVARTLMAGRSNSMRQRLRASAICLELSSSDQWAFESLGVSVTAGGRGRKV